MSYFNPELDEIVFKEHIQTEDNGRGLLPASVLDSYKWNHEYVNPLAVAQKIPLSHYPTLKWGLEVAKVLINVTRNSQKIAIDTTKEKSQAFQAKTAKLQAGIDKENLNFALLRDVVEDVSLYARVQSQDYNRPKSIDDYAQLFKTIALPAVASNYNQDSTFAAMRTEGPNPLLIERVNELPIPNFPLTKQQFRKVMTNDTLEAAVKEGRVYKCDYKLLADRKVKDEENAPYLYAPIALFVEDKNTAELRPVAIQCQQTPGVSNPIYLADGSYDWLIAKTIVEMADGNYHEAVSHLARTHLYIEPFIVATGIHFGIKHPLFKLLMPHFEGTIFINHMAFKTLINPGGSVDKLLSPDLSSILDMAVWGVKDCKLDDSLLPKTFETRGVNDLKNYAYRDDALLYWNAIKKWVGDYLSQTYQKAPENDKDLQKWYADLVSPSGGRLSGLGTTANDRNSRDYLTDVLTFVIYTSSVQHAAVNFPQLNLMTYSPNMPLACFDNFPKTANGQIIPATANDYLNMLPPMEHAKLQLSVGTLLGSVHYTKLGQYEKKHFDDNVTNGVLKNFQSEISGIGSTIRQRNMTRRPYQTLLPSAIPQSINI